MPDFINLDWARSLYQEAGHRLADHYRIYAQAHVQDFDALAEELGNILIAVNWYNTAERRTEVVDVIGALDFFRIRGCWSDALHYGYLAVKAACDLYEGQPGDQLQGLDLIRLQSNPAVLHALQGRYNETECLLAGTLH